MRKVAIVFLVAVILPSLVLAWLAVRSLRDQQFLLERQQSLLYQGVADGLAKSVQDALDQDQRVFTAKLNELLASHTPQELEKSFDSLLRAEWPLAQVGFVVTLSGRLACPAPTSSPEAWAFCADNGRFLGNREVAEVYLNSKALANNYGANAAAVQSSASGQYQYLDADKNSNIASSRKTLPETFQPQAATANSQARELQSDSSANRGQKYASKVQSRNVIPQQKISQAPAASLKDEAAQSQQQEISKVAPSEAEFRQLIGDATEGTLARFVDNKLNLLIWSRSPRDPNLIFGAKVGLPLLIKDLAPLIQAPKSSLSSDICVALLDDTAKPVAMSVPGFSAPWKRPFVATEIGEALPHWEIGVYLTDPLRLQNSARALKVTLGLLISILVLAIAIGSWLIVSDLNRQIRLARQKTDFVSNVSHELKTPLTSIRMFSELLAQGRVEDPAKQKSYLGIITAETARLTRLINNVLDFARMERGEKKYKVEKFNLADLVRETCDTFRPHLETNGFTFRCDVPTEPVFVSGDRDALAQVIVNLLSNAEKYSGDKKEIEILLEHGTCSALTQGGPLSPVGVDDRGGSGAHRSGAPYLACATVTILDRGLGVPKGCEEKIFDQFYRAHDSLSSGIQGSGLGLTLARQLARANAGEVTYAPREGGGSCFVLTVPVVERR